MTRQALFRVLLSLLLLFSQQMATSHVISHWSGSLETAALAQSAAEPAFDADKSSTIAKDQSCNKCLVFAQLGAPLPSSSASYEAPALASLPIDGALVAAAHARTILAFQSRGPPQA